MKKTDLKTNFIETIERVVSNLFNLSHNAFLLLGFRLGTIISGVIFYNTKNQTTLLLFLFFTLGSLIQSSMIDLKGGISGSFILGFLCHWFLTNMSMDFLGKNEYIKLIENGWVNSSPYFWMTLSICVLLIFIFIKWFWNTIHDRILEQPNEKL